MTWLTSNVTAQTAIERGWTTWDVYLSNWGVSSIPGEPNTALFPDPASQALIPSINGVMIGPYSDVDRVKIQFTPNIETPTGNISSFINFTNQKLLSVESPIAYPLGGPISVVLDPWTTIDPTFIADDGSNTATAFSFPGLSDGPLLHLVFFLQSAVIQPLRRYPKVVFGTLSVGAGTAFRRAVPIMGRKQTRITFNSIGPNAMTIRLGLIGYRDFTNSRMIETTLTTLTLAGAGATESFTFGGDIHDTQFLSMWTTVAPGEAASAFFSMESTDISGGGCSCITPPPT